MKRSSNTLLGTAGSSGTSSSPARCRRPSAANGAGGVPVGRLADELGLTDGDWLAYECLLDMVDADFTEAEVRGGAASTIGTVFDRGGFLR